MNILNFLNSPPFFPPLLGREGGASGGKIVQFCGLASLFLREGQRSRRQSGVSLTVLGVILLLASCKEPPLPPIVEGDPFFTLPIIVDGTELKLTAGLNDYYLFTSFNQDNQDIYRLEGNMRPVDCPTCGPQLRIVFRDVQQRSDGSKPVINEVLQGKMYDFYGSQQDTTAYQTKFQAEVDNPNDFSYSWDLGDGTTNSNPAFTHTYPSFPGTFEVILQISSSTCRSEITQQINVPKAPCFPEIGTQFTGNETRILFNTNPLSGLTYNWSFGDGNTAVGATTAHDFQARGAYTVCLSAAGNNCNATHCRNVEVGEADGCAVNFSYETTPVIQPDSLGFGEIEVYWIGRNGKAYSSSLFPQHASSFFEVTEIEPFDTNEQGESTLAYSFNLQCKLFVENEEMNLVINQGRMAVAY